MSNRYAITFSAPWPPSVNHYYGNSGHKKYLLPAAHKYRTALVAEILARGIRPPDKYCHATIDITAHPRDARKYDLDNLLKCMLDATIYAGLVDDDSRYASITIRRGQILEDRSLSTIITYYQ